MFSGKTTELYRILKKYKIAKKKVLRIMYKDDTVKITHNKVEKNGIKVHNLMELTKKINGCDVIGIDEGQFYEDLIEFVEMCVNRWKIVIVAGLDGTFERKPFGQMCQLIPLADSVKKLKAVCSFCGNKAPFSLRFDQNDKVEKKIGVKYYKAACRFCYLDRTAGKNKNVRIV